MKRLIVFLIRKRLGLKKYQCFIFTNQRDKKAMYYFKEDGVMKIEANGIVRPSSVSLNWLLDDVCIIEKLPKEVCKCEH